MAEKKKCSKGKACKKSCGKSKKLPKDCPNDVCPIKEKPQSWFSKALKLFGL